MPILACPNCTSGMNEINRNGVKIDICPTCQGVWLDRGELNKIIELSSEDHSQPYTQSPSYSKPYQPSQHSPYSNTQNMHIDQHSRYRKKSKIESIFDIFD
jgi:uncharacterized protein